ncbi:MAG: D-2-hydroxyacid dehydrogenase family protein [Acidobacteriota bacterium]
MKIVIPDDYQFATKNLRCLELLKAHEVTILGDIHLDANARAALAEAQALVLIRERTKIDQAFLKRTPHLKLISQTGKISRHIDVEACTAAGVLIVEGAGSPIAPAELTWALIMCAWRQLVPAVVEMQNGRWQTNIGQALNGQTLGIWGYGKIGRMVAGFGRAFAMQVQIFGRETSRLAAEQDGYLSVATKESFFATSDVLTVHLRLVEATTGIIKAEDLKRMKPSALFVNTSRAELVETGALENALQIGRPGYAALDVFSEEPIYDLNHPLLNMPNVLCTPHLGYVEQSGYELYFKKAFENVHNFITGNPTNMVNPDALMSKIK